MQFLSSFSVCLFIPWFSVLLALLLRYLSSWNLPESFENLITTITPTWCRVTCCSLLATVESVRATYGVKCSATAVSASWLRTAGLSILAMILPTRAGDNLLLYRRLLIHYLCRWLYLCRCLFDQLRPDVNWIAGFRSTWLSLAATVFAILAADRLWMRATFPLFAWLTTSVSIRTRIPSPTRYTADSCSWLLHRFISPFQLSDRCGRLCVDSAFFYHPI